MFLYASKLYSSDGSGKGLYLRYIFKAKKPVKNTPTIPTTIMITNNHADNEACLFIVPS